jgi:hypothetical protein
MLDLKATINKQKYQREFIYDNTEVLSTSFESFIVDTGAKSAENRINAQIKTQLIEFLNYSEKVLFPDAVKLYQDSIKNDFPIRKYESVLNYLVTLNCSFQRSSLKTSIIMP